MFIGRMVGLQDSDGLHHLTVLTKGLVELVGDNAHAAGMS
jgi:hypothetical protein